MRKYTALLIAVVAVVIAASFIFALNPKRQALGGPIAVPASVSPTGQLTYLKPEFATSSPGTRTPRGIRALDAIARPFRLRGSGPSVPPRKPLGTLSTAPSVAPSTVPPYTLGPVPNGLTRVPAPPAVDSPADAEIIVPRDSGLATLFEEPAPRNTTQVGGVAVPAVQNPWDTNQWRFLVGLPVPAAMEIIQQQFPSFPVARRHVQAGPGMSGAITLRFDNSNTVVSIVRD